MITRPQSDHERFTLLYDELAARITAYMRRLTGGMSTLEPEELTQDTWLKVWRTLESQPTLPHGYVFMVARNTVRDAMRRRVRYLRIINPLPIDTVMDNGERYSELLEDGERDFTEVVESSHDLAPRITVILATMNALQRSALVLHAQGYSNEEVGVKLDYRATTIKTAYYRGRLAFRERWEQEEIV